MIPRRSLVFPSHLRNEWIATDSARQIPLHSLVVESSFRIHKQLQYFSPWLNIRKVKTQPLHPTFQPTFSLRGPFSSTIFIHLWSHNFLKFISHVKSLMYFFSTFVAQFCHYLDPHFLPSLPANDSFRPSFQEVFHHQWLTPLTSERTPRSLPP